MTDRSQTQPESSWSWPDGEDALVAEIHLVSGITVVALGGRLDQSSVRTCRTALERAVPGPECSVVVDLGLVVPGPGAAGLLALMMRWADRRGVLLRFSRVPAEIVRALGALTAAGHPFYDSAVEAAEDAYALRPWQR